MQRYSSEICSAKSLCRVHLISEQAKLNEGERACLLAANSSRPQSRVLSAWGSLMSRHAATVCPECLGLFPVTELRRFCSLIRTSDGLYMAACWLTTSSVLYAHASPCCQLDVAGQANRNVTHALFVSLHLRPALPYTDCSTFCFTFLKYQKGKGNHTVKLFLVCLLLRLIIKSQLDKALVKLWW